MDGRLIGLQVALGIACRQRRQIFGVARIGESGLRQNRLVDRRSDKGRGLTALDRALARGGTQGPYALQAAIAACHARAAVPEDTDWPRIAALYAALAVQAPSPVIELNRAVAVGMAFGPAAALPLVDALAGEPALESYHLLPSVRGDLLAKLGRFDEARIELERAAGMASNSRERASRCASVMTWCSRSTRRAGSISMNTMASPEKMAPATKYGGKMVLCQPGS